MEIESEVLLKDLRKRSRTLLAHTLENSKKINNEIKRLRLQSLGSFTKKKDKTDKLNTFSNKNAKSWNLRNDSSAVNSLLCPNYLCKNQNYTSTSIPNMQLSGKHTESFKSHLHTTCSCINRRSIKECYCNTTAKKAKVHSQRTRCRSSSPCHFRKHSHQIHSSKNDCDIKELFSPPISCETVRRMQKIDYSPKSQFLQNVQNKICSLQTGPWGDVCSTCPRSLVYHKFATPKDLQTTNTDTALKDVGNTNNKSTANSQTLRVDVSVQKNSRKQNEKYSQHEPTQKFDKAVQVSAEKITKPKTVLKRTISSTKVLPDRRKEKSLLKIPSKDKKSVLLRCDECSHCPRNRSKKLAGNRGTRKVNSTFVPTYTKRAESQENEQVQDSLLNQEMNDLQKFREQNYFDTHGSSQTLVSSGSSELLSQYTLNERLFPELYGKIRKNDLVVTIPPCSTLQKKPIHYFPRYIVQQEKNTFNTNYKKKRCQGCPLTGHAIDLGVLKPRAILNSLALKYQKRIP